MNPTIKIRNETGADINIITEVTISAFKTLEISDHTEQFIIEALRVAKALTLSLVAEIESRVVGHIAFSPVSISDGTLQWYGLGPVSVLPEYQKMGIGKALVKTGLFLEGVPQEVFFVLSFDDHMPRGIVTFHEGFKTTAQETSRVD